MSEPFDYGGKLTDGQYRRHPSLPDESRSAEKFIRPLRKSYKHLKCGTVTSMPDKCAETYAANPSYYGKTFCCGCGDYFLVGENGEFVWLDDGSKVGT